MPTSGIDGKRVRVTYAQRKYVKFTPAEGLVE
jgi:hypothetical protein